MASMKEEEEEEVVEEVICKFLSLQKKIKTHLGFSLSILLVLLLTSIIYIYLSMVMASIYVALLGLLC